MAAYSIHHYQAFTDFVGNIHPARWEVIRRETWRSYGRPKTAVHSIRIFYTRHEADEFLTHCENEDAGSACMAAAASERRAGAYCL